MNGEIPTQSQSQSQSQSQTQTQTQSQSQTQMQSQSHNNNNNNNNQTVNQINNNNSQHKPQPQHSSISQTHNTLSSNTFPASVDSAKEKKLRNYKLIADPALKKGSTKVYRYDGVVPGVSDSIDI